MSFVDISRAYFNAKCDQSNPTYVDLPPEDPDHGKMCGLLLRHMYGTRAAADGWQQEYARTLTEDLGFKQGAASPCVFVHPERRLTCSVHGDDFTTGGPKNQLDWFEKALEDHYELKRGGRLGPGPKDDREATVLNRVVRWTEQGLEYEADPRQVEKLLESLDLEDARPAATPGVKSLPDQISRFTAPTGTTHGI